MTTATLRSPSVRPAADRQPQPVVSLLLEHIHPDPRNPRQRVAQADIGELAESLKEVDLLAPITVRCAPGRTDRFVIVCGERRYRAAKAAGWKRIPAIVRNDVDESTALKMMVVENIARKELNPIETARALCLLTRQGGGEMTQEAAAKLFGQSQPWVCNTMRLLKLPESWQARIASGQVATKNASALLTHVDRPEVLAAVELDLSANPEEWKSTSDFAAGLARVVKQLEAVATLAFPAYAIADNPEDLVRPAPAPIPRRRAPASRAQRLPEVVRQISDLIDQLESLADIELVAAAIENRRAEVTT